MAEEAVLLRSGGLDCQVCVPHDWTDEQAIAFAESQRPCGTEHGWSIRREGDKALAGDPERQRCTERDGYVHIVMDA